MSKRMRYRGPDNYGFIYEKLIFGHNRLSIIDLHKRSHQPMISQNKDI